MQYAIPCIQHMKVEFKMQLMRRFAAASAVAALALTGVAGSALAAESGTTPKGDAPVTNPVVHDSQAAPSEDPKGNPKEPSVIGSNFVPGGDENEVVSLSEAAILKVDKKKVKRGEKIVFTLSDKKGYESWVQNGLIEVHSKVYTVGRYSKSVGKDLKVTWTVPADMELGTHKVILKVKDEQLMDTFEVVGDKKGLAKTGAYDVAALFALTAAAGAGAVAVRRRNA